MTSQISPPQQQTGSKTTIAVLVGSNSDIHQNGEPTELVKTLQNTASTRCMLKSCSADRTPFLLPSVLNETKVDGILYAGSYALVLGASLQTALLQLYSSEEIFNYREELLAFIESGEGEYLPGQFRPELVQKEKSKYFGGGYIPTIGIPCKDTPSGGTSAFQSITENPSGCEPRMGAGLFRIDTAVRYVVRAADITGDL